MVDIFNQMIHPDKDISSLLNLLQESVETLFNRSQKIFSFSWFVIPFSNVENLNLSISIYLLNNYKHDIPGF